MPINKKKFQVVHNPINVQIFFFIRIVKLSFDKTIDFDFINFFVL